jgi:hypothetical protein
MRLESVRELKAFLPQHLVRTFAIRMPPVAALTARAQPEASAAVAIAAARLPTRPGYFLGIAPRGKKEYALAVRLQDRALQGSSLVDEITARAKGEVDVRYVGTIRARAGRRARAARGAPWYRSRQRPLLIGCSVGYIASSYIMAGTLGAFVRRGSGRSLYILSNNHVLADENHYPIGEPILQPGALDRGRTGPDAVAKLTKFVRLRANRPNLVDCAIARLDAGVAADVNTLRGLRTLAGTRRGSAEPRETVHKIGRTTGLRSGRITAIELDNVTVEYDMGTLSFDDQIEIEGAERRSFSNAGDSGSLIVDDEYRAIGLLFAGGDHGGTNGKGVTYANSIQRVLSALKVKLAY